MSRGRDQPLLAGAPANFRTAASLLARNWNSGVLIFVLPDGREHRLEGREPGADARLLIHDFRFMRRIMSSGDIGLAEGYMAGEWETPNLSELLGVLADNFTEISRVATGNPFMSAIHGIGHALHGNSRGGSRRNIHKHYDLGNAFYERWLDPSMTYSSARFGKRGEPLFEAQRRKYRTLVQSMGLKQDEHVLEIGCGWGGFAEYAAGEVGAKVTAITISQPQYEFAKRRMFETGLAERANIRMVDYRDVEGQFDRVASIEMFEAVGERYWPTYFSKIRDSLRPGGRAGLQIITIRDELFDAYRRRADFIQKYIFPGGMLPSEKRLKAETEKVGLIWAGVSRFGLNYADTLAEWASRFEGAWEDIRRLGFDERFRRLWCFYLSYCEAGFRTARTDVVQVGLARP